MRVTWRHRRLALLALGTLAAMPAQVAAPERILPVVWNTRLQLQSLDRLAARLERPFEDPVRGRQGNQSATITSCAGYLRETRRGFRAAGDREQRRLQFLGADCRALELLASARPARRSALDDAWLDPRFLPPTIGFLPSQESRRRARAAQAQGLSWKDSEPDLRVTSRGAEQTVVEAAGGDVRMEWYARGDFNGDGVEDLLLRVARYAKQGTYARIGLFLLTREAPNQVLRVLREFE